MIPAPRGVPDPAPAEVRHELDRITDELTAKYAGVLDRGAVARHVNAAFDLVADGAVVHCHLLALAERHARRELHDLAASRASVGR